MMAVAKRVFGRRPYSLPSQEQRPLFTLQAQPQSGARVPHRLDGPPVESRQDARW